MDAQKLTAIYTICIWGGLAIPLLSVITGAIGGALDFSFDFGLDGLDGPFPISLMGICFSVVVFGAVGRMGQGMLPAPAGLAVAVAAGLLGGFLLSRFVIRPLKRNRPLAQGIRDLPGTWGTVKLEIRDDFVGTISVLSAIGSLVTYSACPVEGVDIIPVGRTVEIVRVDEKKQLCVVRPVWPNETEPEENIQH